MDNIYRNNGSHHFWNVSVSGPEKETRIRAHGASAVRFTSPLRLGSLHKLGYRIMYQGIWRYYFFLERCMKLDTRNIHM